MFPIRARPAGPTALGRGLHYLYTLQVPRTICISHGPGSTASPALRSAPVQHPKPRRTKHIVPTGIPLLCVGVLHTNTDRHPPAGASPGPSGPELRAFCRTGECEAHEREGRSVLCPGPRSFPLSCSLLGQEVWGPGGGLTIGHLTHIWRSSGSRGQRCSYREHKKSRGRLPRPRPLCLELGRTLPLRPKNRPARATWGDPALSAKEPPRAPSAMTLTSKYAPSWWPVHGSDGPYLEKRSRGPPNAVFARIS